MRLGNEGFGIKAPLFLEILTLEPSSKNPSRVLVAFLNVFYEDSGSINITFDMWIGNSFLILPLSKLSAMRWCFVFYLCLRSSLLPL